ncbi:MAG: hypothetical protein ACTSQE_00835 [Candidatus Heimdallarchaeaceae archaeon]
MFKLVDLYKMIEQDRNDYLTLFKVCNKDLFYNSLMEGSWSPEMIFRHLLMSFDWMKKFVPDVEEYKTSPIALKWGEEVEDGVPIEDIEKEFHRISPLFRKAIEELTSEQEEEELKSWFGMQPRKKIIAGMLIHESKHHGQLIWIIKRSTGWSDEELYEKLKAEKGEK